MSLEGMAALVSGAGSGIGRATALALSREGARIGLLGRDSAKLEAVRQELATDSIVLPARHEAREEAEEAVDRMARTLGSLDILVNNAGVYEPGAVATIDPAAWSRTLAANLTGPFLLTRAALPHLRARRRGVVLSVASTLGLRPGSGYAAYATSKAGLIMLTQCLALEEAPHGVRACIVCPGVVETPIHDGAGDDPTQRAAYFEGLGRAHPLGRVGQPEEVASLLAFLASDRAAWITGAVIPVDGGIALT